MTTSRLEGFVESSVAVLDGGRYLVREGAYELSGRFLIFERRGETYSRWKSVEFDSTEAALRYLAETLVSEADAREEYEREAPKFWAGLADSFESLGSTDFADAMRRFAGVATDEDLAVVEEAYRESSVWSGGDPEVVAEEIGETIDARRHMNDEEVIAARDEMARDLGVDPESICAEDVRDVLATNAKLRRADGATYTRADLFSDPETDRS